MREIIHNNDNLKEEDINELSIRVKGLMINNGNIYLGNERDIYQFPGGTHEAGETIIDCLKREVLEETGIELDDSDIKELLLKATFMNRDWPREGNNIKTEFYYYLIETDKGLNLDKINLTENEKSGNYRIDMIPLDKAIKTIKENIPKNERNKVIAPDMIETIKEYFKLIGE